MTTPSPIQQIIDCLAISVHTFTLVFRPGAIAVLQVHGAESLDEARAFAASILPNTAYEVRDGDITNGHVKAFHAWTCVRAQERVELSKRLSFLTDAELEQMCNETEMVIDSLLQEQLTEQDDLRLREALDLGEVLELEQIRRLIVKVYKRVAQGGHQ